MDEPSPEVKADRERMLNRLRNLLSGDDFLNFKQPTTIDGQDVDLQDMYFSQEWIEELINNTVDDWRKEYDKEDTSG